MSEFRVYALVNMMGSKGECAVNDGTYSFSLTRGRGTANDVHVVCYGLADRPYGFVADPLKANSMKSKNPNSVFHKEEYAVCLDTSSQNPVRNGGGMLIVNKLKLGGGVTFYSLDGDKWKAGKAMYKRRQGGNGLGIGFLGAMYTLNTIDRHIAAICGGEPFRPAYIRRVCDGKDGTLIRFDRRGL